MLASPLKRRIIAFLGLTSFVILHQLFFNSLGILRHNLDPGHQGLLTIYLIVMAFPAVAIWVGINRWIAVPFFLIPLFLCVLAYFVLQNKSLLLLGVFYLLFFALLEWYDRKSESQLLLDAVDLEKSEAEQNQLQVKLQEVEKDLKASDDKFSTYFSLRKVAEAFAKTLVLDEVAQSVVEEMRRFVPKGDEYLVYLTEEKGGNLSLLASYTQRGEKKVKTKQGNIFDLWVLKNCQPLLVSNTKKDVRFDVKRTEDQGLRSIIIAPVTSQERVIGTCRISSRTADLFDTDDLRILDALGVLASSAFANALLYRRTEELAIRDSLTGLYVQRYFKSRLKEEHRRALLTNSPVSLLMLDLDHFKQYNDMYGHGAGDLMLVRAAEVISHEVPEDAIVARYGGEEFAVILPRMEQEEALKVAESIRASIYEKTLEVRREQTRISASIGVSNMPGDTLEREELIEKADGNMYVAKRRGRNRVWPKGPGKTKI